MKNYRLYGLVLFCFISLSFLGGYAQETPYKAAQLSSPDSWSMVLLPDPQSYVKFERNQGILGLMPRWIREKIEPLNIGVVLCTGVLVEPNDWLNPNGTHANLPGKQQWEAVARAFGRSD